MKLHRLIIISIVTLAVAATALAHGGHKHQFLGTVRTLNGNQLVVATTDDQNVTFTLTDKTRYSKGSSSASRADLKPGVRVSVYVENDGTTARTIKIGN